MNVLEIASCVKKHAVQINHAETNTKNLILKNIAKLLLESESKILAANFNDVQEAKAKKLPNNLIDRLTLNSNRINAMVDSIYELLSMSDPVGKVVFGRVLSSGLKLEQIRVPLGVVGIIYEARPNVTVEAATVCLKSGNGVLLRGGSDAIETNKILVDLMKNAIELSGLNSEILGFVEDTSHKSTLEMMNLLGVLDVLIPRGGETLINLVVKNAKVPVIETGTGNCHVYVDEFADLNMAIKIVINAKVSRPWVCNAVESLLVHENVAEEFLKKIYVEFCKHGVKMVGCEKTVKILPEIELATEQDYATEFLDYKISVKVVKNLSLAIEHINKFSSHHSEAIITQNYSAAESFLSGVDSAAVYVNASTRFTDGFEFGFGAEIGISTQKLHARGPMGLQALTSTKFIVFGNGHVRL